MTDVAVQFRTIAPRLSTSSLSVWHVTEGRDRGTAEAEAVREADLLR